MVRHISLVHVSETFSISPIPLAVALFVSASLLVALCAKHARQVSQKYAEENGNSQPTTPKLLRSPKQMITTISEKAMKPLLHARKSGHLHETAKMKEEDGLWQKAILMGDKCRPPEFSGVIYYDYDGNRIPEMPKSPRAGSMSPLRNFTFPVVEKSGSSVY